MLKGKRYVAILLLCIGLSGCGRANPKEIENDFGEENIGSSSDASENVQLSILDAGIPERLEYTLESGSNENSVKVNAIVHAESYSDMKIVEMTPMVVDDEKLEKIAAALFDNGEYERIKPYRITSMAELQAEMDYLKSLSDDIFAIGGYYSDYVDLNYWIENYDEARVQEMPEGQLIYYEKNTIEETPEDQVIFINDLADGICRLRGYVDGELWELQYREWNDVGQSDEIRIYPLARGIEHRTFEAMDSPYSGNLMNYEDALESTQSILNRLGFENLGNTKNYQLAYVDEKRQLVIDGYRMVFSRSIDGVNGAFMSTDAAIFEGDSLLEGTWQEYAIVTLDSTGIGAISILNPYEMGAIISDDVTMLGFEQIDDIAQSYMTSAISDSEWRTNLEIDSVELAYVTVSYNGKYAALPVWLYYMPDFEEHREVAFGINAIDGEIIQFVWGAQYRNFFN